MCSLLTYLVAFVGLQHNSNNTLCLTNGQGLGENIITQERGRDYFICLLHLAREQEGTAEKAKHQRSRGGGGRECPEADAQSCLFMRARLWG